MSFPAVLKLPGVNNYFQVQYFSTTMYQSKSPLSFPYLIWSIYLYRQRATEEIHLASL